MLKVAQEQVAANQKAQAAAGRRRFAVRLSLFYGSTFAIAGAYMPFFPVWLQARELDPAWIGIVMAMPTVARVVAVPIVTQAAEQRGAISQAITATAMLTVVGLALLALMPNAGAIAAMLLLTACVWTPTIPLTDAYALRGVVFHGGHYGPIRLWGSAAYVIGVLAAGAVAKVIPPVHLIWAIVALAALGALAGLLIEPLGAWDRASTDGPVNPRPLRQSAFLVVLMAAALIQGSHAAYYVFSAIAWEAEGFSTATIAVLWSLCVVAEIVLLALSPRLDVTYSTLMIAGGLGGALRWLLTALEPSLAVLGAVQTMHALSFAATHLGTMGLMVRLVPGHSIATAQGVLTAAVGIVTALASIGCGVLFGRYGQAVYFGMMVMAAVGGVLMLLARRQVDAAYSAKAFSSEVDTGSLEETALKPKASQPQSAGPGG